MFFPEQAELHIFTVPAIGLLLRKKGGKLMRISGSNAFPEEWKAFYEFQRECLDLNDIKGEGTFCIKTLSAAGRPGKHKRCP